MYQPRNINNGGLKFSFNRPHWKTNLRERCSRRIKEARAQLFNSSRNLPNKEELKAFVMDTVQGQWQEFKFSNQMDYSSPSEYIDEEFDETEIIKEIQAELLLQEKSELEEYLLRVSQEEAEYGRYLEELLEDSVLCPLCSKHKLFVCYGADGINQISCNGNCPLYKKVPYGLIEIRHRIDAAVNAHSSCPSIPGFTFTREDSSLYLLCSDCGTFYFVL